MSIKIPIANYHQPIARNVVKQMASNGFLPVIALEAFVEAGRTYQAYNRGGFDEARERITEEFSGAVFWLGGVKALNAIFEKIGQKINKLPNKMVKIDSDDVRNPLANYLQKERKIDGTKILESTMAKFKFIKVLSSVLLANAFIGFALPKINQAITRSYHKKDNKNPIENTTNLPNSKNITPKDLIAKRPTFDEFSTRTENEKDEKDISFGKNALLTIANAFENNRNCQLLSVDVGTASGRAYSARNKDERIEILVRDLGSIYFYMYNMNNMNNLLNRIEQKGNPSRLDPVSAEFATKYMQNYIDTKTGAKASVEEFAREFLGKNDKLPESLNGKFNGSKIKTINLDDFINKELASLVPQEKFEEYKRIAEKMSTLQPEINGKAILTQSQVKDILNGGHINNPEFLKEFYKNRFGNKFMEKYEFVAQNELDSVKKDLINYVKSIIETAEKTNTQEITHKLLRKASNNNLKINALNWSAGFVVSAAFLSTFIPKIQYWVTKQRTGNDNFPGTAQYREENNKQVA